VDLRGREFEGRGEICVLMLDLCDFTLCDNVLEHVCVPRRLTCVRLPCTTRGQYKEWRACKAFADGVEDP
jgi:hypothetical protein